MIRIERILSGIDLGPDTERVLSYTFLFARLWNASVYLLYVIDYLITPPVYMMPYIEEEKRSALKGMKYWRDSLRNLGIETRAEVVMGRLYESFDLSLKNLRADLLVLGYRAHSLRRSSSEKLIKGLSIPMLVVRGEKSEGIRIGKAKVKNILCPVDFSEHSRKALTIAAQFSRLIDSRLYILHVLPGHLLKEKGEKGLRAIDEMTIEVRNNLKSLIEELSIPSFEDHVVVGKPYREIISIARERDIDLIIMGARGLGLIKGIILGSVTEAVLRSSPCPVLIIH